MDASAYLSAIQSLKGETPGEKYKDLHSIAAKIIESSEERAKFMKTGESNLVPSALKPTMRIIVGLKVKSKKAVVEALKSDDVTIVKLALGAKWFFNASNDLLDVQYFIEKLLPFVSLRTRHELIKTLSKCLQARQAESFHREFVMQFGSDQALPLLVACGEEYIFSEISKNQMIVSERMLKELYRKYPQLIIRYLRMIEENTAKTHTAATNSGPRVNLASYIYFLPNLVKNHTQAFVDFVLAIPDNQAWLKLGSTRAEFFLKYASDTLVTYPQVFLDWLPLKMVKSKLHEHEYHDMLLNLFPPDFRKMSTSAIVSDIRKYYPKQGGFELYRQNYRITYGRELLQDRDLLEYKCMYEVFPAEIKAEYSRRFLAKFTDRSKYMHRVYQLPPSETIPLLKEQIKKSSFLTREHCLKYMLQSCDLYKSKADLLEVLQYYNTRHKNEHTVVLQQFLATLTSIFDDMQSLDKEHWRVIMEIVRRAHVKGDFKVSHWYFNPTSLFNAMLRFFLKQCSSSHEAPDDGDSEFLDEIVNMILEYYCEHDHKWDFFEGLELKLEQACLHKFLLAVPLKYPENDGVWKRDKIKLDITSFFVEKLGQFNERMWRAPLDSRVRLSRILIECYPWLVSFATELFVDKEEDRTAKARSLFKKALRKACPEFYQNIIDEHADMINDVTTDDALLVLKQDRSKISSKINAYVAECRNQLSKGDRCTKHFVMALKWYHDLPLKFVDKCLTEIEQKGSVFILGVLLDGKVLSKIIEPYMPKETELKVNSKTAKEEYQRVASLPRALNYTNPPPALEALIPLCQGDYLSVALQNLSSIVQRVPIDRVLSFATRHLANKAISVRKAGIRLVFQISPKTQVRQFLAKVCKEEKNPGIREVIAKMVYEVFTQAPSRDSWQLMKDFIRDVLPDDKSTYDILKKLKAVHVYYATDYLLEILTKINSFSDKDLGAKEKSDLVLSFLNEIDDAQVFNKLPESIITEIMAKYLFVSTLDFIFNIYLFSDANRFEGRLKVFMGILSENLMKMNEPDSAYRPRCYTLMKQVNDRLGNNKIFDFLSDDKNKEMNERFISSVLENTLVRKDLQCFINFNIYRIYFKSPKDPWSFGEKCGNNIDDLVKIYNSQLIIEPYAKCLALIVERSYAMQIFDIIGGMMSYNLRYATFIGLHLLDSKMVPEYSDRYDQFVEIARNSGDLMVEVLLNNFMKEVNCYV